MARLIEFVGNHPLHFVALGVVLVLIAWMEWRRLRQGAQNVGIPQAVRLINDEDAVVIDVREDTEAASGRIPNAKHVPLSVLRQRLQELERYRDRPVILVCRSGSRSGSAASILRKAGFERVYNLKGGMLAWENENLPKARK